MAWSHYLHNRVSYGGGGHWDFPHPEIYVALASTGIQHNNKVQHNYIGLLNPRILVLKYLHNFIKVYKTLVGKGK